MILVDTSVWVDHLRSSDRALTEALNKDRVWIHPAVIGELACGSLRNRAEILSLLRRLPIMPVATDDEALAFIEAHRLMGRGIGYIDVQLLASTALSGGGRLWTRDRRLADAAETLGLRADMR